MDLAIVVDRDDPDHSLSLTVTCEQHGARLHPFGRSRVGQS